MVSCLFLWGETDVTRLRFALPALALAMSAQAAAQKPADAAPVPGSEDRSIVVTGQRPPDGKTIPMSDWRVAESDHVLVYAKGDNDRLEAFAANLERLHFLLSVLLNRVDVEDDALKIKVTLIGDTADFDQLDLRNLRWQRGPYPDAFEAQYHYDPRDDGAVLATTNVDQKIVFQQGTDLAALGGLVADPTTGAVGQQYATANGAVESQKVNEVTSTMSAMGRIYAGFAQHYLMTYFPAAYPRWYLDGFGEMFATMVVRTDGAIEYGHPPQNFRQNVVYYGRYPVSDVLNGRYLNDKRSIPAWNPYQAWAMVHLMFFSEQWRQPLNRYLAAMAKGTAPAEAARALGDVTKLHKEVAGYYGRKVPFEVMTYPRERINEPVMRRLTRAQAELVRGRLIMGARVTIPPALPAGSDPAAAEKRLKLRAKAIAQQASWLGDLRRDAAQAAASPEAQLLLAEAECRIGNHGACLEAADKALTLAPGAPQALAWKGVALAGEAAAGPADQRAAKMKVARGFLVRSNRADTEAVVPLIGYYRSFADVGEAVPDPAFAGLMKAADGVPAAPSTRLLVGTELARRGDARAAKQTLRPVVDGAWESPEKPKAKEVVDRLK
jgi:hypothetical protein